MRTLRHSILFLCLSAFLVPATGYGETYNFYFGKPKKKGSQKQPDKVVRDGEAVEETPSEEEARPAPAPDAKAPIVIHNHNNNTINVPSQNDSPGELQTVIVGQSWSNRMKFGLSALYYPSKHIGPSFFDSSLLDPNRDEGGRRTSFGGMMSIGFAESSIWTLMFYLGVHHASQINKTMTQLGMDLEIYPFASSEAVVPAPIELAALLGGTSHFFGDGKLLSGHVGGRLTLNLTSKFGLTSVARFGFDYVMLEAGIQTRLSDNFVSGFASAGGAARRQTLLHARNGWHG